MSFELLIIAAISVAGIAGSISLLVRDGYRRIPTR